MKTLMMLAPSLDPLKQDPTRASTPYRLQGSARDHLPVLELAHGNVLDTISCCVKWPDELARLYGIQVEDIERQGESSIFDDDRYDKTIWRPMLSALPDQRFLRQDNLNIKGYVAFFSGKLVEKGRVVGTYYHSLGGSGDFEMVLQKK